MSRFAPHEDAVLLPYVDRLCRWDEVLPRLPRRSRWGARARLLTLRKKHGTVWTIDQRQRPRDERGRLL